MSTFKIEADVDFANMEQAVLTSKFLSDLKTLQSGGRLKIESTPASTTSDVRVTAVTGQEAENGDVKAPKQRASRAKKVVGVTTGEVKETEVVEFEDVDDFEGPDTSGEPKKPAAIVIDIEAIRALVPKKVANHREAIKSKLAEYGAANVTSIDPKDYNAFHAFLIALS